jgi:DNA-binding CsgD family transcriptional regulator
MLHTMEQRESGRGEDLQSAKVSSLSPREQDVLMLVANGLSGREICDRLHISESTLKKHKTRLIRKMDVKTTNELIVLVNKDERFARLLT